MNQIAFSISISLESNFPIYLTGENPSSIETSYYGHVTGSYSDNEKETRFEVGTLRFKYVNLDRRFEFGLSLFDATDLSQDLCDYCMPLIDIKYDSLKADLFPDGDEPFKNNILIISEVAILEEYRGQNMALAIIREIINRYSHDCGAIILKPFPLQFGKSKADIERLKKYNLSKLSKDEKSAFIKLFRYYSKLGFKRYKRNDFMLLDPGLSLPNLNELGINEYAEFIKRA